MNHEKTHVLLTGGAGYIGSHTAVGLCEAGYTPVILDDFSNSHPAVVERLTALTGRSLAVERGDVKDSSFVRAVLEKYRCNAVVHLAGLKAVGDSVARPLLYYRHNLDGLISLLEAMQASACRTIVFSSSATVYGCPQRLPIDETATCSPGSPYAFTKLMCEQILGSLAVSAGDWRCGVLRYFNPVGAHPSGLIGEDPNGVPNNLMPFISQVAVGKREQVQIFGNDYDTRDGTGVRDYLHVCDLAEGHVAAVTKLLGGMPGFTVNLGTGQGTSVLGVLQAFEKASRRRIAHSFAPRRAGDAAACFADVSRARALLGWRAHRSLDDMCRDAWNWQQKNPDGYSIATPANARTEARPVVAA
jgi:UDP-glucose 4-epimerase